MPLIKRKPVHLHPLPSLSSILQPLPTSTAPNPIPNPGDPSTSSPPEVHDQLAPAPTSYIPPDASTDEEQLDRLLGVYNGASGLATTKGKKPGQTLLTGQIATNGDEENGVENVAWKVWDRECWYIPETGEIFMDYE